MTAQEAQALLEQVRERLIAQRNGLKFLRGNRAVKKTDAALVALDQLSAHLAGQEKAVRVKMLEGLREEFIIEYKKLGYPLYENGEQRPIGLKIVDQKIAEAK